MAYPRSFLSVHNFRLAFDRIVRSTHKDYKAFYSHLFQSYSVSLDANINVLKDEIMRGSYQPAQPTLVFIPKKSGILRPLTLLSFRDLIVYQAIVNVVAQKMQRVQQEYVDTKSFGCIFAGPKSPFFFRSWKKGYRRYSEAVNAAYHRGNCFVADFDLVSCYELIDHNLLVSCIQRYLRSDDLLTLFRRCLAGWTTNIAGQHLRHGLPQGPEASAFLAECVLFRFDAIKFRNVRYLRYVDDIKLMSKQEVLLRRALLKLDLMSKELGLVPQAQKISIGKVEHVEQLTKIIPSQVVAEIERAGKGSQKLVYAMFTKSLSRKNRVDKIVDDTKFAYSLMRLDPRRSVMLRIAPLLLKRPDLSFVFSAYLKRFPANKEAAEILLATLKSDPAYDNAAAHYIDAMDVCEPEFPKTRYRRVVASASRRSEEKSILLRIATLSFRGRRVGPRDAVRLLQDEPSPLVKNIVLHRLFGDDDGQPYKLADCIALLEESVKGVDEDLARCSAMALLSHSLQCELLWQSPGNANDSVKTLMLGLGLRSRRPGRICLLDKFFSSHGVNINFNWNKALDCELADAERRCLRLQQLRVNDPTAMVLMLDTFNEVLLQKFSQAHPQLQSAYARARGRHNHPDIGNWLTNGAVQPILSKGIGWFRAVHDARVKSDLAHARSRMGQRTKAISFTRAKQLLSGGKEAWTELIDVWKALC